MTDPFANVDSVIEASVKAMGSTLFREWAGQPARFFHVPGDPPFECFQVSISPPSAGRLTVLAASIDTNDDAELELATEGRVEDLDEMIADALATINRWKQRLSS